jgi:hypothetical protein
MVYAKEVSPTLPHPPPKPFNQLRDRLRLQRHSIRSELQHVHLISVFYSLSRQAPSGQHGPLRLSRFAGSAGVLYLTE